jgi:predicted enzyme related to lactoylglutathione lyase
MKDHLSHFMLIVKDVQTTAKFYEEKMGFEIEWNTPEWAELKMENGMSLALKRRDENDPVGSGGMGFAVNDCRLATDALKEKGVEITKDCEDRENDVLTQFRDPDGDIIWIVQSKK